MTVKPQETSKFVEAAIKAIQPITMILPQDWLPPYPTFFRVAGPKIATATTYKLPNYLYLLYRVTGASYPQSRRPNNLRQLLFNQRIRFIRDHATTAFISRSEEAFNDVMEREDIVQIEP